MRSEVSGTPLQTVVAILVLTLTLGGLSACQSDNEDVAKKHTSKTTAVSPDARATVGLGDIVVSVRPGAVKHDGKLTLSQRSATAAALPSSMTGTLAATTPKVSIDLASTSLIGRATVQRNVPATWRDNWVPVWVWQDDDGGWQWLPTSVKRDGNHQVATATTGHFSDGFLAAFDAGAAAKRVTDELAGFFTGRANKPNPECDGEDEVRENVTVTSDNGDAVKWCLGMDDGSPVLKVTNNRRTFAEVVTTTNVEVIDGAQYGISIGNLVRASGEFLTKFAARFPSDRSVYLLKAGETMTFRVPADAAGVELSGSGTGFLLQILMRAVDLYGTVAKAAGLTATTNGERLFNLLGTGAGTNKDWAKTAFRCLESFTSEFTADFSRPASTAFEDVGHALSFAAHCGLKIGATSIADSGPLAWMVSATAATVATVAGAVIGLVEALFMAVREVSDAIARGFGSKNDPIYTIRTRSKTNQALYGRWRVHGGELTVDADGTASSYGHGVCPETWDQTHWCNAVTEYTVAPDGESLLLTVTRTFVRDEQTGETAPDPDGVPVGSVYTMRPEGEDYAFTSLRYPDGSIFDEGGGNGLGNPWLCRAESSDPEMRCGA